MTAQAGFFEPGPSLLSCTKPRDEAGLLTTLFGMLLLRREMGNGTAWNGGTVTYGRIDDSEGIHGLRERDCCGGCCSIAC